MSLLKVLAILLLLISGNQCLAKTTISKQKPVSTKKGLSDYKQCKTDAFAQSKKYKNNSKKRRTTLAKMLIQCREEFPSYHMINVCKAAALKNYRNSPTDFKLAMKECRSEYKKLKFSTKDLVPVTWHKDKIYFAGAGLNSVLKLRSQNDTIGMSEVFGNFNCKNTVGAKNNKNLIEYLLIGNSLDSWRPFAHSKQNKIIKNLSLSEKNPKVISDTLGELNYNSKSKEVSNFLPSSFCYFDRQLDYSVDAIKTYYLLNLDSNTATPYFGIAFYRDRKKPSVKKVLRILKKKWPFDITVARKENYTLISELPIDEFDNEGDPKNLCKGARPNSEIVMIGHLNKAKKADFVVVANVNNLCTFGDKAAERFLAAGLKDNN